MPHHYRLTLISSIITVAHLSLICQQQHHLNADAFSIIPTVGTSRPTILTLSPVVTSRRSIVGGGIRTADGTLRATNEPSSGGNNDNDNNDNMKKTKYRKMISLARSIIVKPISAVAPQNIANLLTDATANTIDLAVEEAARASTRLSTPPPQPPSTLQLPSDAALSLLLSDTAVSSSTTIALDSLAIAKTATVDAFDSAMSTIRETEGVLETLKEDLRVSRREVLEAIEDAETAAVAASVASREGMGEAVKNAMQVSERGMAADRSMDVGEIDDDETQVFRMGSAVSEIDISSLTYDDVDYHLSEMSPPFIGEDQCLVPGEAVVRVEKAPENSRRIFAGIDITASVDDVWNVLTNYQQLQQVVPNLVVNEVQEIYPSTVDPTVPYTIQTSVQSEEQCRALSTLMAGAKLRQIGGAKVVGINFSARTTLEVREWPQGIPDFFHFTDDVYEGETRSQRARKEKGQRLERYHFPRPFAISKLPTRDISMQSVEDDDGEFRLYQGVWRMQPLPGCAGDGGSAMRLTYAVEISPRPYLPVALVEGRISRDLCDNLTAIRDFVTADDFKGGAGMKAKEGITET